MTSVVFARLVRAAVTLKGLGKVEPRLAFRVERSLRDLCDRKRGVLRWVEHGRGKVRAVDLAEHNRASWVADALPGTSSDSERGGSSSPVELSDRVEAGRVSRQAVRDSGLVDGLSLSIASGVKVLERRLGAGDRQEAEARAVEVEADCRRLAQLVARYTVPVDASKLPTVDPGCVSCARVGEFSEVYERSPRLGLCRWCGDHRGVGRKWPPVEAVRLMKERGARAAGVWLAREAVL